MPAHEYMGYTVVVNALPAPNNRSYSVFSIHLSSPGVPLDQVALVYQEGIRANVICETAQEAHEDAAERAHAWIDAHPARNRALYSFDVNQVLLMRLAPRRFVHLVGLGNARFHPSSYPSLSALSLQNIKLTSSLQCNDRHKPNGDITIRRFMRFLDG